MKKVKVTKTKKEIQKELNKAIPREIKILFGKFSFFSFLYILFFGILYPFFFMKRISPFFSLFLFVFFISFYIYMLFDLKKNRKSFFSILCVYLIFIVFVTISFSIIRFVLSLEI